MTRWIATALLACLVWAGGCQGMGDVNVSRRPPRPVDEVDEIIMSLSPPTALNWDSMPGPDGFETQVHFFQLAEPFSVTVKGSVEFALYEGRATPQTLADAEPFHVWRFEGDELGKHLGRSIVGWGYGLRLDWGRKAPTASSVTLLARYHPPGGQVKSSQPIHLAMRPK